MALQKSSKSPGVLRQISTSVPSTDSIYGTAGSFEVEVLEEYLTKIPSFEAGIYQRAEHMTGFSGFTAC